MRNGKMMNRLAAFVALMLVAACDRNRMPDVPRTPVGPPTGRTGQSLRFSSNATDPDANGVSIRFDWEDGVISEWGPLQASGTAWADTHSWQSAGTYRVQAQALDSKGAVSLWSAFATVEIESAETYPSRVVATVPVGKAPVDVAILPNSQYAYVSCRDSFKVMVVRVQDGQVVARVEMPWKPAGLAASVNGDRVFVAGLDGYLRVIGTSTNVVEDSVDLGAGVLAFGVAVSSDGERVYVTDCGYPWLLVLSTSPCQVQDTVEVGPAPVGVVASGGYAYVTDDSAGTVTVVRASDGEVVATLGVGEKPHWAAASGDGQFVYVAVTGDDVVRVIRTSDNAVSGSMAAGREPSGVCVVGDYLYVANLRSHDVRVVRRADGKLMATIPVGSGPSSARASADGRYVFVTNEYSGTLSIIGY